MRPLLSLTAASLTLALTACSNNPKIVAECKGSPKDPSNEGPALVGQGYGRDMSPIPLNAVVFSDKETASHVAIHGLYAAKTDAEVVEVGVRLLNCTKANVNVAVRTSFMDAKQRPTEKPTAWKNVLIPAGTTGEYTALSVGTDNVKYYLVEVRNGTL